MKIFICTDHEGHWVGVASVVVAESEAQARDLLVAELKTHGLKSDGKFALREISADEPGAYVLQDGEY